jgi:hypothetical protein
MNYSDKLVYRLLTTSVMASFPPGLLMRCSEVRMFPASVAPSPQPGSSGGIEVFS